MKTYNKNINEKSKYCALSDLDDEDINLSKSKIDFNRSERIYQEFKDFIDLDLPSGTLWCTHNLGATCGDDAETWYGDLYAWGETTPGEFTNNFQVDIQTSTFPINKPERKYAKEIQLFNDYDAAFKLNNTHHMPTSVQIEELLNNTNYYIVKNYKGINRLNGMIFESLKDKNNFIFIPMCFGVRSLNCNRGRFWSKTADLWHEEEAKIFYMSDALVDVAHSPIYIKLPIRAVKNTGQIYEGITYNALADIDDDEDIVLTKSNIDLSKTDRTYNEFKFVDDNFVDFNLPSGTLWAKNNLGATCGKTIESWIGNYYAWGELEPKDEYNHLTYKFYKQTNIWQYDVIKYNNDDNLTKLLPEDDVATQQLGKNFSIPTVEQFNELLDHTKQKWVFDYNHIEELKGLKFIDPKNNKNFIFMPITGYKEDKRLEIGATDAYYHTSNINATKYVSDSAMSFSFNKEDHAQIERGPRDQGIVIRPVTSKKLMFKESTNYNDEALLNFNKTI